MKKIIFGALCLVAALAFTGCATTTSQTKSSSIKEGDSVKNGSKKRTMVDHQGATFGAAVPQWVIAVASGQYDAGYLSKSMPGLEGKKAFVVQGRGTNLDFVKSWATVYSIETEVGGLLERQTGKVVTEKMTGSQSAKGSQTTPEEVDKKLTDYRMAMQNVRIVGLEKIAEYWTETEVSEKGNVVDDYFEYYAVYAMDKKLLSVQLNNVLKDETDTELRDAVMKSLVDELTVASNDKSVEEAADNYFIQQNVFMDASETNYFVYE